MSKKAEAPGNTLSPDIAKIKQMAEKLRQAQEQLIRLERFKTLMDEIPVGIANIDIKGKITYFNKRFEEISGYSREEIVGKNAFKLGLFSRETLKLVIKRIEERIMGKAFGPLEIRLKRKDGKWIWLEERAKLLKERGIPVGLQAIGEDITERKKAEEALTNEATRRRILIEQSRDGIVVLDQEGNVYEANQRFTEMLGYSHEEILQLNVWDWEFQYPPEQVLDMIRTVDETGDHFETQHRRKDGTTYNVEISTNAAVFAGQKLIFCVCRDITERKRAEQELHEKNERLDAQNEELRATEEELQSAKEQLEERVKERTAELEATNKELIEAQEQLVRSEKLAAIGQLAGGVGHELRNPLGAIKNAVYYVREKVAKNGLGQKEPRVMEFLDIVDDEINASNKIISDLLGFSRVGKSSVSPTRIEKVIEDALSYVPIPENIELIKKLDTELPQVEVDSDQIRQVLVNLVTNATQAMPEGGKLTLTARQSESFLEVKVSDTGNGIPGDTIAKIFDPLFTTKAKGIGLGLAVCRTIIERHQGQIEAESEVGKGTTFTVKLRLPGKNDMRGGADGEDQHPGG
jgi:two-component system cell cycle sensor histidine kinase PleC